MTETKINFRLAIKSVLLGIALISVNACVRCQAQEPIESGDSHCDSTLRIAQKARTPMLSNMLSHWCAPYSRWPTGDLTGRVSYPGFHIYYYDRPYSPVHVPRWTPEQLASSGNSSSHFRDVYRAVEQHAMAGSNDDAITRDRVLEFSDWPEYQAARLRWESGINRGLAPNN